MPIWSTAPVSQQPHLTLIRWRIFEVTREKGNVPRPGEVDRHFVGYCPENREGRVSSRIMQFDPETMRGVTHSGRVYQLQGAPGTNMDAMYVWGYWKDAYKVTEEKDVTEEIVREEA